MNFLEACRKIIDGGCIARASFGTHFKFDKDKCLSEVVEISTEVDLIPYKLTEDEIFAVDWKVVE